MGVISATNREKMFDPESGELLHEVVRPLSMTSSIATVRREDFSDPSEFLQAAIIEIPPNHSFAPHVHLERERTFTNLRAQETWVVMSGRVEVTFYTDNGVLISKAILEAGDLSISFKGGHGYKTMTSDALVYEFKSGPYEGQAIDKAFIKID